MHRLWLELELNAAAAAKTKILLGPYNKLSVLQAHLVEDRKESEISNKIIDGSENKAHIVQMVGPQSRNMYNLPTTNNTFPSKQAPQLEKLYTLNNSTSVVKQEL